MAHSKAPWFHSWYKPIIRISKKIDLIIIHDSMFDDNITTVIGSSSAISTSKIKKITAIRKNRNEKGSRADLFGSNPHSNGDLFSRSSMFFFDNKDVKIITVVVITRATVAVIVIVVITYLVDTNFLIGSQVY